MRPFAESDLDDVHDLRSRPEVSRYLYGEPLSRDEAREFLGGRMEAVALEKEGDSLALAVVVPRLGRVLGQVSLNWRSAEHAQGEVGFVFHPDAQGHGYATEAAAQMLRLGFEGLGLHRVYGRCDDRNTKSAAVMERLGMRREAHLVENGVFKGEWGSELVYAVLAREWKERQA
nr:GNAT family N-acetyltransferase [Motilibacter deserti]